VYDERNNQDRYDKNQYNKTKLRVYVAEKQEENKKMNNNKKMKNSFKVEKLKSDYYVVKESNYYAADLNVNFYDVEDYNQKEENNKSNINFMTVSMIHCCNCYQVFKFKNTLFHHLHSESFKLTHCSNKKNQNYIIICSYADKVFE